MPFCIFPLRDCIQSYLARWRFFLTSDSESPFYVDARLHREHIYLAGYHSPEENPTFLGVKWIQSLDVNIKNNQLWRTGQ